MHGEAIKPAKLIVGCVATGSPQVLPRGCGVAPTIASGLASECLSERMCVKLLPERMNEQMNEMNETEAMGYLPIITH